ncbi:hypothetical protein LMG27174_06963 [Paraburkholderia rhynchosiae]|uniref:Uncharacterized protein n=1 Tax=Paraburkholderia rhynchosiae TaxID=487049 RepID=A0A6J5CSX3_9BURK|nr:hypothetical protein LMG27174_06963 [Paraburkholderia rhynchosiae]
MTSGEPYPLSFGFFIQPAPTPGVAVPPAVPPACAYGIADKAITRAEVQNVLPICVMAYPRRRCLMQASAAHMTKAPHSSCLLSLIRRLYNGRQATKSTTENSRNAVASEKCRPSRRSFARPGAPPRPAVQRAVRAARLWWLLIWIDACFVGIGASFRRADSHVQHVKNRDKGCRFNRLARKLAAFTCSQSGVQARASSARLQESIGAHSDSRLIRNVPAPCSPLNLPVAPLTRARLVEQECRRTWRREREATGQNFLRHREPPYRENHHSPL